jgi:hypothetical protein
VAPPMPVNYGRCAPHCQHDREHGDTRRRSPVY